MVRVSTRYTGVVCAMTLYILCMFDDWNKSTMNNTKIILKVPLFDLSTERCGLRWAIEYPGTMVPQKLDM